MKFDGKDAALKTERRTILFLHGTWSTTAGSFEELLRQPKFSGPAIRGYNSTYLAFEMSTLKKSVKENALELRKKLNTLKVKDENLTVVAFSRGCLVAKEVFKNKTKIIFAAGTL